MGVFSGSNPLSSSINLSQFYREKKHKKSPKSRGPPALHVFRKVNVHAAIKHTSLDALPFSPPIRLSRPPPTLTAPVDLVAGEVPLAGTSHPSLLHSSSAYP